MGDSEGNCTETLKASTLTCLGPFRQSLGRLLAWQNEEYRPKLLNLKFLFEIIWAHPGNVSTAGKSTAKKILT